MYGDGDTQVPWQHQEPLTACLSKWVDLKILASTDCEGIVTGFHLQQTHRQDRSGHVAHCCSHQ
jgi:hypothetical protein